MKEVMMAVLKIMGEPKISREMHMISITKLSKVGCFPLSCPSLSISHRPKYANGGRTSELAILPELILG